MKGFIKKDLLLIKANLKSLVIILLLFAFLTLKGEFELTFIVPLIGVMLFISTFSYDEYNHWDAYAISLPHGRQNVIKGKYISAIILMFILIIICFLLSLTSYFLTRQPVNDIYFIKQQINQLLVGLFSISLIINVMFPLIIKFGATNGRIWLFVIMFILIGGLGILSQYIDFGHLDNILKPFSPYRFVLIPLIIIILLGISYLISKKLYQKKEF